MKLTRKKLFIIIPIIFIFLFMSYYKIYLRPILNEIGFNMRELSLLQETITEILHKEKELERIRNNIVHTEKLLNDRIDELPDEVDAYDLIYLLSQAEKNSKLMRHSLIFLEPAYHGDYEEHSVRFSFTSDYNGFLAFLETLNSLPNRPTISNMQISFNSDEIKTNTSVEVPEQTKQEKYDLKVETTLNFYVKGKK
ncbi:MAG: type 4a pilus biogenesis protein PilO [Caldicoprobacterales bacterium]